MYSRVNGMNFTSITDTGSVALGTPTTLTDSTTNAVTATSHTHAITGFVPSSYLDTDGTLAADSDTKVATQKATKAYVDAQTDSNSAIQTEIDNIESSMGIGSDSNMAPFSNNYLDTAGSFSQAFGLLDTQIKANEDAIPLKVSKSGDSMTGNLVMGGNTVTGLATPTADTQAAPKSYVDAVVAGLSWKNAVKAGTTSNVDLSTGGTLTVDGVSTSAGDRILVMNQTSASENGIYIVASGAWTRSLDFDSLTPIDEVNGAAVYVEEGTVSGDISYTVISQVNTLGTDDITFAQFNGVSTTGAGNGLIKAGSVISIDPDGTTLTSAAAGVKISDSVMSTLNNKLDATATAANSSKLANVPLFYAGSATLGIPSIGTSNGVMEIGRYIDFHTTGSTVDFDVRLNCSSADNLEIDGGNLICNASASVVSSLYVGVNLAVTGVISESGTTLSSKYLGLHAKSDDSNKLDGKLASTAAGNSTIVARNSSGHVYANYFNTSASATTGAPTNVMVETGSDGYIRKQTLTSLRSHLNVLSSNADDDMGGKLTIIKNVGATPNYGSGQLELRNTDAGDVSLGFHRSGYTACQLRHEANGLILSGTASTTAANLNVLGDVYCTTLHGRATTANYADLAEKYTIEGNQSEPGQVVLIGSDNNDCIISDSIASQQVLGVVSTNPGLMMNAELDDGHYVALKGRVPCKVFGKVKKGEALVSFKDGMAIGINHEFVVDQNEPGIIFGKALKASNEVGVEVIEVVVL